MSRKNNPLKISFSALGTLRDFSYLVRYQPTVSAILSVFNGERFLAEALRSVFGQTYRPSEVIVVDDGSTDGSVAIARSFKGVACYTQSNSGAGAARNFAISKSKGEFIAFLDQDDLWMPDKLRVQISYLIRNPRIDYALADQMIFIEPDANLPSALVKRWLCQEDLREPHTGYLPGTLLARRSTFEKYGYFDPSFRGTSDAEWFFRVKDAGARMSILPRVLLRKRFHDSNHCYETHVSDAEFLNIVRASVKRRRLIQTENRQLTHQEPEIKNARMITLERELKHICKRDSLDPLKVNLEISARDAMFVEGRERHYLRTGHSALECIRAALEQTGRTKHTVASILNFASGWGRELRFMRAYFETCPITCADIDEDALRFCRDIFGVNTITSGCDFKNILSGKKYDLIWCGSLFTHLKKNRFEDLLRSFSSSLGKEGLLIFTTLGMAAFPELLGIEKRHGLSASRLFKVASEYLATGYGYAPYPDHRDYGIAMTRFSWIKKQVENSGNLKLVSFGGKKWTNLQDVSVCLKG